MLFAATVFWILCCLDSRGLNSSSSDPLNRRRILLRLSKKPSKIYNRQWLGGWVGERGCYFTRAKHAAAPLRILDYGGIPPTAVVKAWLWGALILPKMSATSNIGNKTTWGDKQSWSGPTVTAEGALLFKKKGYTLLYAAEKASLTNPSREQWGPASGKQDHLHAAVRRFQGPQRPIKGALMEDDKRQPTPALSVWASSHRYVCLPSSFVFFLLYFIFWNCSNIPHPSTPHCCRLIPQCGEVWVKGWT